MAFRANGGHVFVGYIRDGTEAARAYDKRARELPGEFCVPNFPDANSRKS